MKTISVNGKTINLSRDSEAKEVYDAAAAEFEETYGSRPSARAAARTWDSDLEIAAIQALQELLDARSAAKDEEVTDVSHVVELP